MEFQLNILPYIPQALGYSRENLSCLPLILLYIARIMTLVFSVILVYFAIKIAPVSKWMFLLLGLMPRTLSLMASLSYDALLIGISFFLIALFWIMLLMIRRKSGIKICFSSLWLVFSCHFVNPLFNPGALFLLIPIHKIGSWKKFILLLQANVTCFIATRLPSLVLMVFIPVKTVNAANSKSFGNSCKPDNNSEGKCRLTEQDPLDPELLKPTYQSNGAGSSIRKNISTYFGVLFNTIFTIKRVLS